MFCQCFKCPAVFSVEANHLPVSNATFAADWPPQLVMQVGNGDQIPLL